MRKIAFTMALVAILIINSIPVVAGDYDSDLVLSYDGGFHQYKSRIVDIYIDDLMVETGDMPAVIIDGRTLVPVREVFEHEAIGAQVNWNGATQEVYVSYLDQFIVLQINSTTAYVNGVKNELDVPAKLIRDANKQSSKTMLPLRFVAEQMGYDVQWDEANFAVKLYSEGFVPAEEEETGNETETEQGNNPTTLVSGHDLIVKDSLEFMPSGQWVDQNSSGQSLATSLRSNPLAYIGSEVETIPRTQNTIVTDIESTTSDSVEIYNLLFHYDEASPEKVTFEVSADGPISGIITSLEGNVMELYVLKATLDMNTTEFEYDDHPFLDSLEIVEYTGRETGNRNCVIRFVLNDTGNIFNIRMNENREKIFIDAVMHQIDAVTIGQNSTGDYVDLRGVETDQVLAYRNDAKTLSFDIDRVNTMITKSFTGVNGEFIEGLSLSQKDTTTANVTLNLKEAAQYKIEYPGNNTTRIQLTGSLPAGFSYTTGQSSAFALEGVGEYIADMSVLTGLDLYKDRIFEVTIPGNHLSRIGSQKIEVNSEGIDDVSFKLDSNGDTLMTIKTNKIQGVEASMYGSDLVFEVKDPQDVYDRILTLDPGHGGYKPGASAAGYYEKNIVLDVALKLKELLDQDPHIKTYYVRTDDSHVELKDRADLANDSQSDLFLSLHVNSYWATRTGAETLYMNRSTNNGYSNLAFAELMHNTYVDNTAFISKRLSERDDLYVLKYTKMPAVLLEMGYISFSGDRALLLDENQQEIMAQAIYDGLNKTFEAIGK